MTTLMQELAEADCRSLLAAAPVGRLGFSSGALPVILPVNFTITGDTVFVASEGGAKVEAARHHNVACLEVDHYDPLEHDGWSVLATGRLRIAGDGEDLRLLGHLRPWASTAPEFLLALDIDLWSGRRVRHPDAAATVLPASRRRSGH